MLMRTIEPSETFLYEIVSAGLVIISISQQPVL